MPSLPPPGPDRRLAVLALAVCVLAVAAAVVSFVEGSFVGIVWVLLAGVSSNMAWFYFRKAKLERARRAEAAGDPAA
ncbi:hypothetical protein K2224_26850 [Streptomyces sp. BHT-5-2]|uniref:hypothetical protein n=1 Tax=unclassified Streptomyces TaxID=2593676 RepID=UPI001C8F1CAB|nr:hypothetical protein [Streptomyces sp. BHT-5-2]QZL06347.1 hypothetical protein K2224_26850 [Streptomyces sp. BHT-5-2]